MVELETTITAVESDLGSLLGLSRRIDREISKTQQQPLTFRIYYTVYTFLPARTRFRFMDANDDQRRRLDALEWYSTRIHVIFLRK